MRQILPFWLLLVCCFWQQAAAQSSCTYKTRIVVYDHATGVAMPGVYLELRSADRRFITGDDGVAMMDSLCEGTYLLMAKAVGYEMLETTILAGKDQILRLRNASKNLTLAEVTAKRIDPRSTSSKDTIGAEEMERNKGKVLADYLKSVAGVTILQTGPSVMKPVIHGLHSQRVLIMNAGIRQEGQQWGSEHAPEIDPFIARRLTVIKGASAIRYGADAIGGVILVEPRELPHEPGLNAEINLVGMSNGRAGVASGIIEQHLGKFYDICWRLQGTARKSGSIHTPDLLLENTGFDEYNWSGSVGVERAHWGVETFYSRFRTRLGVFAGSHIGNLSDLRRIIESGETLTNDRFSYDIDKPRQEVTHQLFSLKAFLQIKGLGILRGQYGYQFNHRFEYDKDRPYNDSLAALDIPELELRLYTQTADLTLETRNVGGFTLVTGLSGMIQDNQYGGQRFFVPNYVLYNGSAYGLLRWRRQKWELEGGLRYDYRDQSVYRNVNGEVVENAYTFRIPNFSVGALYKADSLTVIRLNIGTAQRAPSINEWFSNGLHHGTASFETGDPSLGTEKALSGSAGVQYQTGRWSVDASVYTMLINDYIYLVPDTNEVLTISGAYPSFVYRHVNAFFTGADVTLDWDITSRINLKSKNSLVFARNSSAGRYLELVPAPRFDQLLSYAFQPAGHWSGLTAGISVLHVMEQWRYTSGSDYVAPPAAYTLLGIECSGDYTWAGQTIRVGLSVNNALNTRYRDYMNRLRYYSDEAGTNVILRITVPLHFKTAEHNHEH